MFCIVCLFLTLSTTFCLFYLPSCPRMTINDPWISYEKGINGYNSNYFFLTYKGHSHPKWQITIRGGGKIDIPLYHNILPDDIVSIFGCQVLIKKKCRPCQATGHLPEASDGSILPAVAYWVQKLNNVPYMWGKNQTLHVLLPVTSRKR